MAIDELLAQSDRARRPYSTQPGARNPEIRDPLARAAANRARIPTAAAQSIGDALPPRAFGDAAMRTTAAPPSAVRASGPGQVAKAVGARAIRLGATPVPPASSRLKGATRAFGVGALAIPAAASSIESFNTPTEQFRERIGLDPNSGSVVGDVAARTAGALENAGNAVTGNIAREVGEALGGYLADFRDRAVTPAYATRNPGRDAGKAAAQQSTPDGESGADASGEVSARQSNTTTAPADRPRLYRDASGKGFSDQPIAGGVEYKPTANLSVVAAPSDLQDQYRRASVANSELAAILNGTDPASLEARSRQQQAFARSTAAENQIATQRRLDEAARNARIDAGSLLNRGFRPRGQAQQLAELQVKAAEAGREVPGAEFIRTPEQESALTAGKARAKSDLALAEAQRSLEEQKGIAAGITNDQALDQKEVLSRLFSLPETATPAQRRALIDRALVGSGKDPDAGRFIGIDSLAPDGFTTLKSALDTRTGQIVGGGGAVGSPAKPPKHSEGAIYRSNGQLLRIENGRPVPFQPPK